jgi:hypothetical protein
MGALWEVLHSECSSNEGTQQQHRSLCYLKSIAGAVENCSFVHLKVERVDDMISFILREVNETLKVVANGAWMRVTIEGDGYVVLTGSDLKIPTAAQPTLGQYEHHADC